MHLTPGQRILSLGAAVAFGFIQNSIADEVGVDHPARFVALLLGVGLAFLGLSSGKEKEKKDAASSSAGRMASNAPAGAPSAQASAEVAPSYPCAMPFAQETDVDRFMSTTRVLAKEILEPWHRQQMKERLGGFTPADIPGGISRITGEHFNPGDLVSAMNEASIFKHAFAVVSFLAFAHNLRWEHTVEGEMLRKRLIFELIPMLERQVPPGLNVDGDQLRATATEEARRTIVCAYLSAETLKNRWVDESGPITHERTSPSARQETLPVTARRWLETPERFPKNPAWIMEEDLAASLGDETEGHAPERLQMLEDLCGPVTRECLSRAIELMEAPLDRDAIVEAWRRKQGHPA